MSREMPSSAAASDAPVVTARTATSKRRVRRRNVSWRRRTSIRPSLGGKDGLDAFEVASGNQHLAAGNGGRQRDRVAPARHAHGFHVDGSVAVVADQRLALLVVATRRADAAGVERNGEVILVALDH